MRAAMFLTFQDRPLDSPFVERVWRSQSHSAGVFLSIAASHFEIAVTRHKGRIIRMAALARLAKNEARSAVEYFCAVAQKVSRLPKLAFQAAVGDEIDQISKETGAEIPEGSPRPKFMEEVEPWPDPVDGREAGL